ncbi:hypothetical protein LEL_05689 [Akanthomyces lecanii RCEF 1005]|uniref:Uncharacterized protein n=1 Tax=Akanthomyces lecanii RCEF 1005 TaxID=1081108 RepID=A0A168G493_CORDF|nr:hypothetical protein LEL_05689 [Akanthomyces lecanii RCEF 1005]
MDFNTAKVDAKCRRLLRLTDARDIQSDAFAAKPWIGCDGVMSFDNFQPGRYISNNPNPRNYYRTAEELATTLNVWATNSASQTFKGSLLGQTHWREHFDPPALRWLGVPVTDDYVWYPNSVYHSFKEYEKENGPPALGPEKPHAVCYVVDSTPFDVYSLRTSEVKTIVLSALFNHAKPEYNHLDSFGVTAISFWDRDVRVVQGLVNFHTRDVDIRVTEVQRSDNGFRGSDGSVDPRFLALLAYNSADVLPLPKY